MVVGKGLELNRFLKRSLSSFIALSVLELKVYGSIMILSLGGGK